MSEVFRLGHWELSKAVTLLSDEQVFQDVLERCSTEGVSSGGCLPVTLLRSLIALHAIDDASQISAFKRLIHELDSDGLFKDGWDSVMLQSDDDNKAGNKSSSDLSTCEQWLQDWKHKEEEKISANMKTKENHDDEDDSDLFGDSDLTSSVGFVKKWMRIERPRIHSVQSAMQRSVSGMEFNQPPPMEPTPTITPPSADLLSKVVSFIDDSKRQRASTNFGTISDHRKIVAEQQKRRKADMYAKMREAQARKRRAELLAGQTKPKKSRKSPQKRKLESIHGGTQTMSNAEGQRSMNDSYQMGSDINGDLGLNDHYSGLKEHNDDGMLSIDALLSDGLTDSPLPSLRKGSASVSPGKRRKTEQS